MSTDRPLRRLTLVGWLLGMVVGVIAAWVAVNAAGGLAEARDAVGHVDVRWLIPAVAGETASLGSKGDRDSSLVEVSCGCCWSSEDPEVGVVAGAVGDGAWGHPQ